MNKIFIILVLVSGILYADILHKCQIKWETNYRMVKFCVDKQTKAKQILSTRPDNEIMRNCKSKWVDNYNMVKYCYDKQLEAKQSLGL